jgi:hypothetical protein
MAEGIRQRINTFKEGIAEYSPECALRIPQKKQDGLEEREAKVCIFNTQKLLFG